MEQSRMKALASGIVAVAVLAIFAGCKEPGTGSRTVLRIIVEPEEGIKQIVPDISMVCTNYDVVGTARLRSLSR